MVTVATPAAAEVDHDLHVEFVHFGHQTGKVATGHTELVVMNIDERILRPGKNVFRDYQRGRWIVLFKVHSLAQHRLDQPYCKYKSGQTCMHGVNFSEK